MEFCFDVLKPLSRVFSDLFLYDGKDGETVFRYLVGCCLDRTSISEYCEDHTAVSADTVLKLGFVPLDAMTGACNRLLAVSARIGLKSGLFRGCSTSIDYHDVPYGGKGREYTVKTIVNGKVRRCYRYAVASLTGNKRFSAVAVQMYKSGNSNQELVDKLLDRSPAGFDPVLMDRGFAGVDVYDLVEGKGRDFLTPYKINGRTDELYKQSLLDGETVKMYRMRKAGGHWRSVYMHLLPHPSDEYHAYACSREDINVKEHYPFRWNEENMFKVLNCLKPVTSTTHESFRLLLFTISLILASLWKFLVRSKQHMTVKRFKKQLHTLLEVHTLDVDDPCQKNKTTAKG